MVEMVPVVDDLLAAPVGVALLDRLELAARGLFCPFDALTDSDPEAVGRAVVAVGTMPVETLLHVTLDAADRLAGPWTGGAPESLALAYELAPARRPIAEAVWQRFCEPLTGPMDTQEHWLSGRESQMAVEPGLTDFSSVYGNGEFTWSGFWTVSAPPNGIHDDLVAAWEMWPGPISRLQMPIDPGARVWSIDHPADWVRPTSWPSRGWRPSRMRDGSSQGPTSTRATWHASPRCPISTRCERRSTATSCPTGVPSPASMTACT